MPAEKAAGGERRAEAGAFGAQCGATAQLVGGRFHVGVVEGLETVGAVVVEARAKRPLRREGEVQPGASEAAEVAPAAGFEQAGLRRREIGEARRGRVAVGQRLRSGGGRLDGLHLGGGQRRQRRELRPGEQFRQRGPLESGQCDIELSANFHLARGDVGQAGVVAVLLRQRGSRAEKQCAEEERKAHGGVMRVA
jgi:hypothetical protein